MPLIATTAIWIISASALGCIFVRPRNVAEAWWACGGALLLVLTGLIPISHAGAAVYKGVDVYLFLAGMMLLSELAREEGVFDWIAEIAASQAGGSPRKLFLLIYGAGTMVTALLSNDATAVVLTPAVLTAVRRLKVDPKPHLLACAFIANAGSFILPISNPANLVIYGQHIPPLLMWIGQYILPSLGAVIITFLGLRLVHRKSLEGTINESLPKRKLSTGGQMALWGLLDTALVLLGASGIGWSLGAPTFIAAVVSVLMVAMQKPSLIYRVGSSVSWSVLPLVAGLFVIVEAIGSTGVTNVLVEGLDTAARFGTCLGNLMTAFCVALLSNIANNLPVGLISGAAVQSVHGKLAGAVLIGVDLGPNLSVNGSLATILWLIVLRRENVTITSWQFFKTGIIVMPLALISSVLLLWF